MKLVKGIGSERKGACWMSALHLYTRQSKTWSDHPDCVSMTVRALCIALNDSCKDGEREELIGPHLFAPLGTNTTETDEQRRAYICADRAVRLFAPLALDAAGLKDEANRLRNLPKIVDCETALAGRDAAKTASAIAWRSATTSQASGWASGNASMSAKESARGTPLESANASTLALNNAITSQKENAYKYSHGGHKGMRAFLLQLILDCCAIGKLGDIKPTCTKESLLEYLNKD